MIEIVPIKKLSSVICVPGSKYIANRALIIASLAEGKTTLVNIPENDDINNSIDALRQLGIEIKKEGENVAVHGGVQKLKVPKGQIDVGHSGTLLRFIIGLSSLTSGKTLITGSDRIKERPIHDLVESLKDLGIKSMSHSGFPPVEVIGGTFCGGSTKLRGDVSSQFLSSILLVAPYAKKDVEITINGDLVSKSYVDMTIKLMHEFNVSVEKEGYRRFIVKSGQRYSAKDFIIPGDQSSANYFFAAAAIVPGIVKVTGIDAKEVFGEGKFTDALVECGCMMKKSKDSVQINGTSHLTGIEIDMSSMPDAVQTMCIVASCASGITRIKNIGNLKHKESDRILDTATELRKLGIEVITSEDEIVVKGGTICPGIIDSHNDHRMAMSFGVLGLKYPGIKINNPECVSKSFPNFWDKLKELGARIKDV